MMQGEYGVDRMLSETLQKDYSTTKAENRAVHVNSNSIKPSEGMATSSEAIRAVVMAPSAALVTQRCEETLRSIICTDKFAALSKMFNQSTPSGSLEGVLQLKSPPLVAGSLDLQLIHLRLSTGAYGRSPQLFYGDIQQVLDHSMVNFYSKILVIISSISRLFFGQPPYF